MNKMIKEEAYNRIKQTMDDYFEFVYLVKRMREAQIEKDILEMRIRFKIDQDEKISDEDNVEFAAVMCNAVFYEDKVDEYLKKMGEEK